MDHDILGEEEPGGFTALLHESLGLPGGGHNRAELKRMEQGEIGEGHPK